MANGNQDTLLNSIFRFFSQGAGTMSPRERGLMEAGIGPLPTAAPIINPQQQTVAPSASVPEDLNDTIVRVAAQRLAQEAQENPLPPVTQPLVSTQGGVGGGVEGKVQKKTREARPAKGESNFLRNLIRFGVPIGAGIAGTVNPNLLPQAAGLATGFEGEVQRREDIAREERATKPFIIVDPDTGEQTTIDVPKKAIVQQKRKDGNIFQQLGIDPELIGDPDRKPTAAAKSLRETRRGQKFTDNQEADIRANMKLFPDRTRDEIIDAMKKKGQL